MTDLINPNLSILLVDGIKIDSNLLLDILKYFNSLKKFQWTVYGDGVRLGDFEHSVEWNYSVDNSTTSTTYTFERKDLSFWVV